MRWKYGKYGEATLTAERRKDFRYAEDLKAKVKAALPGVDVKFVQ